MKFLGIGNNLKAINMLDKPRRFSDPIRQSNK